MMFFTVTNIRKKGSLALKLALVIVLVAVLLPYVHGMMLEVNAMEEMQIPLPEETEVPQQLPEENPALPNESENSENAEQQLAQAELAEAEPADDPEAADGPVEEEYPGEPVRVDGELWLPLTFWQEVATGLSY